MKKNAIAICNSWNYLFCTLISIDNCESAERAGPSISFLMQHFTHVSLPIFFEVFDFNFPLSTVSYFVLMLTMRFLREKKKLENFHSVRVLLLRGKISDETFSQIFAMMKCIVLNQNAEFLCLHRRNFPRENIP